MTKQKIKIEEQYKKLSHKEFVLSRPDSYIGSIKSEPKEIFTIEDINNLNNIKIVKKLIDYNAGFVKIFDEILVNASDHSIRTGKVKAIKVEINGNEISVWNDGDGIPVVIHKDEKVYVPELIFGHLLTGENYNDDDERIVGGRNGIGSKACNIYSKMFMVETADGKNYFKQIFTDNLSTDKKGKLPKPKIKQSSKNFTKITFLPDYEKFGLEKLTDDLKSLLIKRVIDIAAYNPTIKVYYNGTLIPIKSFKDYIKLYISDKHEVFYEKLNDKFEIAVVKSDFERFEQVSMVNGIATIEGGSHVNIIINNITGKLKNILNKGNKYNINPNDVKSKIFLFVNSKIVNPEFTAQTKEVLSSRASGFSKDCEISDNFIKKISKSDITQDILDYIELKDQLALKKAVKNGNSTRVRIAKLDDANRAGTRESQKCSLFLTEGDCLHENTKITIFRNGVIKTIKIKDVILDDVVITHNSNFGIVNNISKKIEKAVKIKLTNGEEIICSKNHKWYVYDTLNDNFCFIKTSDLNKQYKMVKNRNVNIKNFHKIIDIININDKKYNFLLKITNEEIYSSKTHKFSVYDINENNIKMIECEKLNKEIHYLIEYNLL